MSSEILNVAAEVVKNASILSKAKDVVTAHPVGACVVGAGVAVLALFGGYKLAQKCFTAKEVIVVKVEAAPVAPPAK